MWKTSHAPTQPVRRVRVYITPVPAHVHRAPARAPAHQNCTGAFYNGIFIIPFLQWNLYKIYMLPFPVLSTMEFIWHFPVLSRMEFMWFFLSGTFYNGIDFGPVLSTMEFIFPVLSTMEFIWYLFRYFLQWNLYGTRGLGGLWMPTSKRTVADPRLPSSSSVPTGPASPGQLVVLAGFVSCQMPVSLHIITEGRLQMQN